MIRTLLAALALSSLLSAGAPLAAETDFDFNAKGLTLRSATGRTMVGVTRDSSAVWSLHLNKNGRAKFNFSSGKTQTATYRRLDSYIICFKGLVANEPNTEVCKRAEKKGRGLDWLTVDLKTKNGKTTWAKTAKNEDIGSSQLVYSFAGDTAVDRNSYVADVSKWAGHLIVGRTLKDKEAWSALLGIDGRLQFVFGSGKRFFGNYQLSGSEICMTFPSNPTANSCRTPTAKNGKILWAGSENGEASSELVFMKKVESEGPRPVFQGPMKNLSFYSATPDGLTLAATSSTKSQLHLVNPNTNGVYGTLDMPYPYDTEFSRDSRLMGVVQDGGIEIFDLATGKFLRAIPTPFGHAAPTEIGFLPSRESLVIGDKSGMVRIINWQTGELLAEQVFDNGSAIANLAVSGSGLIGLGSKKGRLAVLDGELNPIEGLVAQSTDTFGGMIFTKDDRFFLAASREDKLFSFDLSLTATQKVRTLKLPTDALWSVEGNSTGDQVVVGLDRSLGFLSLPELKIVETWKEVSSSTIERASYLPDAGGVSFVTKNKEIQTWAGSSSAASQLNKNATTSKSKSKLTFENQKKEFKIANARTLAEYKTVLSKSKASYDAGKCDEYEEALVNLRLMDRQTDCATAAQRRQILAQFDAALAAKDCTLAQNIADSISMSTKKPAECQKSVDYERDLAAYTAAKDGGDCAVVRDLSAKFNEPDAGDDCELLLALSGDSPRIMYLSGIKYDTSGDHIRAKQLYLEIMNRFPEDDLAIDAANRLTALADLEKADQAQAQLAAETAAAIKAAEARAAAAERAARKAADEAEKQRMARAAEVRRADQAQRDAQAAQQRAQAAQRQAQADADARTRAQQPRRDPACDRVYIGMEFKGGMLGIFRYRVQGMNPVTGRVTIRERDSGTTQEIRCSQVP